MKSHIKNKSELIELRYCCLWLLYTFTIFLSVGYTRELWFQILLLPMIRIISLFSKLFDLSKMLAKICQSLFIVSVIICYWIFSLHFSFNFSLPFINSFFFYDIFHGEVLLTIIFHRVIFFSEKAPLSKFLLPVYRIFKRFYIDIFLIVICYIIVYHFLRLEYGWGLILSWNNFWHTLRFYIYLYLIFIAIAATWYIVGKLFNKIIINKKTNEITYEK